VDAIGSDDYFAAARPINNPRWRVRDNLPGTREFCPLVRRTDTIRAAEQYDCAAQLEELNAEFGHDVLMRSAVWLTIKESRASFAIEHEQDQRDRIRRFAAVMERRIGHVPKPFVLPISAVITEKPQNVVRYDEVLEAFSAPLMARYSDRYAFKDVRRKYEDGIESNFEFHAYDDALHAWRFPDLTAQAEYMAWVIDRTIHREMRREADVLREWTLARRMVKDIIDGPDADIDRIIRSVRDNRGVLSNKLRKEFPVLQDPQIVEDLAMALRNAFKDFGGTGTLQNNADAEE
jgi:hypothetical protein